MTPIHPATAAACGIVLFFLPGLLFLSLARTGRAPSPLRLDEALFVMVATSVAVSAWVGLVLAEAGLFSLTRAAAVEVVGGVVTLAAARFRLGAPMRIDGGVRAMLPAALVLALSILVHARPTEYVFGGRDPGAYIATMALIARTGGIVVIDDTVHSIPAEDVDLFYRNPDGPRFGWTRFMGFSLEHPSTGRVFPTFLHLFQSFGAYLFQAMGTRGALAAPPVFGILGTLAVFFSVRRIFSDPVALVASLLLTGNVLQVWFARYPASEPMSQFLIFFGLLAVRLWEESGRSALGLLAGAAFGLSLLVRIDSVLILVPLTAYLITRRARHDLAWRDALSLLAPMAASALHLAVHVLFWASKYVADIANRPYWRQPAWVWAMAGVAAAAACTTAHLAGAPVRRWLESRSHWASRAAQVLVIAVAAYAYGIRPLLSAWAGADNNDPSLAWSDPTWLHALGFRRLAAQDAQALVRFGWFVSPLVIVLGVAGLLLTMQRWERRFLLPTLLGITFAAFYFYKMRVWHDYFFAMRRTIPVILPLTLTWASYALVHLWHRGRLARVAAAVGGLAVAASAWRATAPVLRWREWEGAVRFVSNVARRFGPQDVVIFEQVKSLHLLSLPLWAHHGVNVLELARFNPDPAKLQHLLEHWRPRYRNIYFVHTPRTDLCATFLETVDEFRFGAFEWERPTDRPPRQPEWHSLDFRISRVVRPEDLQVPALPFIDIGGSDHLQVSGFFDKEGGAGETFRWTGACASVYMPGAMRGRNVVIRASTGRRPVGDVPHADGSGSLVRVAPAEVHVSVSGVSLGTFLAGPEWKDELVQLPYPLPSAPPVLTLRVRPWRPSNVLSGSQDTRELGVMIDRIEIRGPS